MPADLSLITIDSRLSLPVRCDESTPPPIVVSRKSARSCVKPVQISDQHTVKTRAQTEPRRLV